MANERVSAQDWHYLAAVLETHKDKFPVPSHLDRYISALRSSFPQKEEVGKLRDVLEEAYDFLGGVNGAVTVREKILVALAKP